MSKDLLLLVVVVLHVHSSTDVPAYENNVCKNIWDYYTIETNENCWHNPDVGSTTDDIIKRHGYECETHEYITEDGYINTLFRIPPDVNKGGRKRPVLLHHGFMANSLSFVSIGNRSMALFLARRGFDVWLANSRGTLYAKGHLNFTKDDAEYWDFSQHEIGLYDLPAQIDFISNQTGGDDKIIFVGHSMGTTASYIYAILRKDHAERHVERIISLSPVAYLTNFGGMAAVVAPLSKVAMPVMSWLNIFAILKDEKGYEGDFCCTFYGIFLCKYLLLFMSGFELNQMQAEDLPLAFKYGPPAISVKVLKHYSQQLNSGGRFQHFDYGRRGNLRRYNSIEPPSYNLSAIEIPVHLFYGSSDVMADPQDVHLLYETLKCPNKTLFHVSPDFSVRFGHLDFTMAKDAARLLYGPMLQAMDARSMEDDQ